MKGRKRTVTHIVVTRLDEPPRVYMLMADYACVSGANAAKNAAPRRGRRRERAVTPGAQIRDP